MKLLGFTVSNFRSFKEPQTLELASGLSQKAILDGSLRDSLSPVTALFGANASGKSNFLEAISYAMSAVKNSATAWQDTERYPVPPHSPFGLDRECAKYPSQFELEFIHEGQRYLYGFEYSRRGVQREWMSYVPKARWSPCFERVVEDDEAGETSWNNSFMNKTQQKELGKVNRKELLLSVALRTGHSILGPLAQDLVNSMHALPMISEEHRRAGVERIADLIRSNKFHPDEVSLLLQAADTGIVNVTVDERRIPVEVLERFKQALRVFETGDQGEPDGGFTDAEIQDVIYGLVFHHRGENGETYRMGISDESDGTLAWLTFAPTIISTLREGGILVADELDASLHIQLLEMIVQCFTDSSININDAQLILTAHNTNVMEHLHDLGIRESGIWFVEKNQSGASELYSLADFPNRVDANYEKRYLSGRYGAVPSLSPAIIRGLVVGE